MERTRVVRRAALALVRVGGVLEVRHRCRPAAVTEVPGPGQRAQGRRGGLIGEGEQGSLSDLPLPGRWRVIGSTEKLATGGAQNGVGEGVGAGVGVGTGGAEGSGVGVGTGVGVGRGSGVQPGVGAGVGVSPEMFGRTAIWAAAVAVVSKAWPPVKEARSGSAAGRPRRRSPGPCAPGPRCRCLRGGGGGCGRHHAGRSSPP